jgi:aspartate kinase
MHCRSSFEDGTGTLVVSEQDTMERPSVTAVTHAEEARVTLAGVRDEPGIAGQVFRALSEANVNVDMIIQNEPVSVHQRADLSFTVEADHLRDASEALGGLGLSERLETDERVGKVSVVGAGMRSHPGVAAKVFETLGQNGINIEMIATSPIKISCVIDAERIPDAVNALHQAFELGPEAVRREDPTGTHRPVVPPEDEDRSSVEAA